VSVTAEVTGGRFPLPEGVDLSAYRIVQEALSNAMRHAPGSQVNVRVGYHPDCLQLEVRNDAAAADGPASVTAGSGHGLVGMRERAAMLGGTLFAAPVPGGGFRVTAVLPVDSAYAGEAGTGKPDAGQPPSSAAST
jgi:signal transduction histidine kinase